MVTSIALIVLRGNHIRFTDLPHIDTKILVH